MNVATCFGKLVDRVGVEQGNIWNSVFYSNKSFCRSNQLWPHLPPENRNLGAVHGGIGSWKHKIEFAPFDVAVLHPDVSAHGGFTVQMGSSMFE